MSNYLLDTNIVIALVQDDRAVVDKVRGSTVYLPSIVLGELFYGAYNST